MTNTLSIAILGLALNTAAIMPAAYANTSPCFQATEAAEKVRVEYNTSYLQEAATLEERACLEVKMYQDMVDAMKSYDSVCTDTTTRIGAVTARQAYELEIKSYERQRDEATQRCGR
jgi:Skp family chaperone for outer membrane proteins